MNKYEALCNFYSGFGIPAYEENSVPEKAKMPYITYEAITSGFDSQNVALSLQIFFKSESLMKIDALTDKLSDALRGHVKLKCDEGYIILYRGEPFAQNVSTGDKATKCKYVNISADFITL